MGDHAPPSRGAQARAATTPAKAPSGRAEDGASVEHVDSRTLEDGTLALPQEAISAKAAGSGAVEALSKLWARHWPSVAAGFLGLLLFTFAIGRGYNHDEEQYVAAGVLAMQAELYRDFVYLQTPYYPLLLAWVYGAFGLDGDYFQAARLLNFLLTVTACGVLWSVARRLTGDHRVGLATAMMFATSTAILPAVDSTRNDMAPCAAALIAVALVLRALRSDRRETVSLIVAGVLMAIAVGMKLSWFFVPACVMGYVLVGVGDRPLHRRIGDFAAPLALGGMIGGLPILGSASNDWAAFVEGVYTYHRETPAIWHEAVGRAHYFGIEHLAEFLNHRVLSDATVASLVLLACTAVATRRRAVGHVVRDRLRGSHAALVFWLTGMALVFAFLPRPPYIQYFYPFGAFLALCLPFVFHAMRPFGNARTAIFAGAVIVGCLPGSLLLLQNGARLFQPDKWMINRVEEAGLGMEAAMTAQKARGPVLTLTPLFPLEAGLDVYPELSAGPFFFRTADRLGADEIEAFAAVGPRTLPALLDRRPPAAVLVGKEPAFLEQPLLDYAQRNGYIEYPVPRFKDLRFFVRPAKR